MNKSENVRVYLDILPFNPKKKRRSPEMNDFDDEYKISVRRKDGQGMSNEEAETIIYQYFLFKRTGKELGKK
jgi:hypothetical protein